MATNNTPNPEDILGPQNQTAQVGGRDVRYDTYIVPRAGYVEGFAQAYAMAQLDHYIDFGDASNDTQRRAAFLAGWREFEQRFNNPNPADQALLNDRFRALIADGNGRFTGDSEIFVEFTNARGQVSVRRMTVNAALADGNVSYEEYEGALEAWISVNNDYTRQQFRNLPEAFRRGQTWEQYQAEGGLRNGRGQCGRDVRIYAEQNLKLPDGNEIDIFMMSHCPNGICVVPAPRTPGMTLDAPEAAVIEDVQYRAPYRPIFVGESSLDLNGLSPSVNAEEQRLAVQRDRGGMAHAGNWYLPPPERAPARGAMVRGPRDERAEGIRDGGPEGIQSIIPGLNRRGEGVSFPTTTPQGRGAAPEAYVYSQFTDYFAGGDQGHLGVLANLTRVVRGAEGQSYVQGDNGLKPISVEAWEGRNNLTTDTPSAFTQLTRSELFRTAEGIDHFSHLVVTAEAEQTLVRRLPAEMLVTQGDQQIINWPAIVGGNLRITRALTPDEASAVQALQGLEQQAMFNVASFGSYPGVISAQERAGRMQSITGVFAGNTSPTVQERDGAPITIEQSLRDYSHNEGLNITDWNPNVLIASYERTTGQQVPAGLVNPYDYVVWDRAAQPQVRAALDVDRMRIPRDIRRGGDAAVAAARANTVRITGHESDVPEALVAELRAGGSRATEAYRQYVAVELLRPEGAANFERIIQRGGTQEEMRVAQGRGSYRRPGGEFQALTRDENGTATLTPGTPRHLMAVASGQFAGSQRDADLITLDTLSFLNQQEGGNERGWARALHRATQDEGTDQHRQLLGYTSDRDADQDAQFLERYLGSAPGADRRRFNGHLRYEGTPILSRVGQILTLGLYTPGSTNNMNDVQDEVIQPAMAARLTEIRGKVEAGTALSPDERRFLDIMQRNFREGAVAERADASVGFADAFEPRRNEITGQAGRLTGDAAFDPDYLAISDRLAQASGGSLADRNAVIEVGRENADNTHLFGDAEVRAEQQQIERGDSVTFTGQADTAALDRGLAGESARLERIRAGLPLDVGLAATVEGAVAPELANMSVASLFPTGANRPARAGQILASITTDSSSQLAAYAVRVLGQTTATQGIFAEAVLGLNLAGVEGLPAGFTGHVDTLRTAYAARETNPGAYQSAVSAVARDFAGARDNSGRSGLPEAVTDGVLNAVAQNAEAVPAAYDAIFSSTVRLTNGGGSVPFGNAFLRNMNTNVERGAVTTAIFGTTNNDHLAAVAQFQRTLGGVTGVTRTTTTVEVPVAVGQRGAWSDLSAPQITRGADGQLQVADFGALSRQLDILRTANSGQISQGETNQAISGNMSRTSPGITGVTLLHLLANERAQGVRGPATALLNQLDNGGRHGSEFAHLMTTQADAIIAAGSDQAAIGAIYSNLLTTLQTPQNLEAYAALTQQIAQSPVIAGQQQALISGLISNNGHGLQTLLSGLDTAAQQQVLSDLQGLLTGNNSDRLTSYLTSLAVSQEAGMLNRRGVSQTDIIIVIAALIGLGHESRTPGDPGDTVIDPTKPVTLEPGDPTLGGVFPPPIVTGGGFLSGAGSSGWTWDPVPLASALVGSAVAGSVDGGDGRDQEREGQVDGIITPLGGAVAARPPRGRSQK
jgi:hypothetical protein